MKIVGTKAIVTKFHGPGNVRGSRYSARAEGNSVVIVGADNSLGFEGNHCAAALALCAKLGWTGKLAMGQLPDGCYAHVFVNELSLYAIEHDRAVGTYSITQPALAGSKPKPKPKAFAALATDASWVPTREELLLLAARDAPYWAPEIAPERLDVLSDRLVKRGLPPLSSEERLRIYPKE